MRVFCLVAGVIICAGGVVVAQQDEAFELIVCPATEENKRNTEGSIVVLEDGTLLLAYSRYRATSGDNEYADIAAKTSTDGGRTWSADFLLQPNDAKLSVRVAHLLRLQSGKIGFCYSRVNSESDASMWWRVSEDECKTWFEPVRVTQPGYCVAGPDSLLQLRSGRIIEPCSFTPNYKEHPRYANVVCYSDDEGQSWQRCQPIQTPGGGNFDEPAVVELKDGRLLMLGRTTPGPMYQCFSEDGGATWTTPEPSPLIHPASPATLKRIPSTGDLLVVWNNSTSHRWPLTAAISQDEGKTWEHFRDLETETPGVSQYAYASVAFYQDRVLLTYWVMNAVGLSLKFRSIPVSWFYAG